MSLWQRAECYDPAPWKVLLGNDETDRLFACTVERDLSDLGTYRHNNYFIIPICTRTRNVTSLAADSDYNVLANRCNEIITFLVSRYIKIFLLCYYLWHHILNTMEHILDASSAPKNYLPAIQENFVTCAQTSEARYLRRTQATGEPRQY